MAAIIDKDVKNVNLVFGSPIITGVDANDQVKETFLAGHFPLKLAVTNLVDFPQVFSCCQLAPCYDDANKTVVVEFSSIDELHRFASDVEANANLNTQAAFIGINAVDDSAETFPENPPAEPPLEPVEPPLEPAIEPLPVESTTTGSKSKGK